jgi:hypothetical protein
MPAPTNHGAIERLAEALARLLADWWRKQEQEKAAVGETAAQAEVRRGGDDPR